MDGILLIVEGDDNLGGLAEMLDGSVPRRRKFLTKNTKSTRGRNWTVWRWLVHFVYLQKWSKKYKPMVTRSVMWWNLVS